MRKRSIAIFMFFCLGLFALAQTVTNAPPPPPGSPSLQFLTTQLGILIPFIVPGVIALIKAEIPKVPTWILPILAPAIGALTDYIGQKAGASGPGTMAAIFLGSAGVGVREVYDQVKGLLPAGTPDPTPSAAAPPAPPSAPKLPMLLLFGALSIGIIGCASFVSNAKKTEYAIANVANGGMKSWAQYYHAATNNPAAFGVTLQEIEAQHQQVNAAARKLGASLATVDTFVAAYATNSATQPALQSAINALSADGSQLAALIASFTGKTNLVAGP